MKTKLLQTLLLMFFFSTLVAYGQNQWLPREKNEKDVFNHFGHHPSTHVKSLQNDEKEFFPQEMQKRSFKNKQQTPTKQQTNFNKANKQGLDSIIIIGAETTKNIFEYDDHGNLILYFNYYRVGAAGNWTLYYKYEYTYDNNDNQILMIGYYWNQVTNNWTNSSKREYTYDNNSNQTSHVYSIWNALTNNWIGQKYEYAYDNNDNRTLSILYHWNEETNNFEENSKVEYTYDNNDNETLRINYDWSGVTNNWRGSSKEEYTYDNNDNRILMIRYNWKQTTNSWEKSRKYEFTYDNNDNQTSYAEYIWDGEIWIGESKEEMTYDLSYSITDLIYNFEFGKWFAQNNMIVKSAMFYWSGTDWREVESDILYWSGKEINGISDITKDNVAITVYPNPTTGQLIIENGELTVNNVEIFDISGRKQALPHHFLSSSHSLVNISHLSSGIYFVKISTEAGEIVRKIVKE